MNKQINTTNHFSSTFGDAAAPILAMNFMGYLRLQLEGLYYLNNFHLFHYLIIPTMFLLSNERPQWCINEPWVFLVSRSVCIKSIAKVKQGINPCFDKGCGNCTNVDTQGTGKEWFPFAVMLLRGDPRVSQRKQGAEGFWGFYKGMEQQRKQGAEGSWGFYKKWSKTERN